MWEANKSVWVSLLAILIFCVLWWLIEQALGKTVHCTSVLYNWIIIRGGSSHSLSTCYASVCIASIASWTMNFLTLTQSELHMEQISPLYTCVCLLLMAGWAVERVLDLLPMAYLHGKPQQWGWWSALHFDLQSLCHTQSYMTNPCRYACSTEMLSDAQLQVVQLVCPLHKARH